MADSDQDHQFDNVVLNMEYFNETFMCILLQRRAEERFSSTQERYLNSVIFRVLDRNREIYY